MPDRVRLADEHPDDARPWSRNLVLDRADGFADADVPPAVTAVAQAAAARVVGEGQPAGERVVPFAARRL
jgi:hypothetical protein